MQIRTAKELIVYQKAFELAMQIFHISQRFPAEERFALTGQIRRSSRSVVKTCVKRGQNVVMRLISSVN